MDKEKTLKIRAIIYCHYELDLNKFIKHESAIVPNTVCDFIDYRYKDVNDFIELGVLDNEHYVDAILSTGYNIRKEDYGKGIEEIIVFRLIENFLLSLLTNVIKEYKPSKKQKIMYEKYNSDENIDIVKEIYIKDLICDDNKDIFQRANFDVAHFTFKMLDICKIINEFNPVILK